MVKDIGEENIKLATKVQNIEYGEDGVKVRTDNGNFEADCVIMTVSIGVLNSNHIKYEPEIPAWKSTALSQCKMAVFCKVFMNFKTRFWGEKDQFYIASEQKGYYPMFISLPQSQTPGQNILFCIVVGNEAKRIEKLENETIKDEI